MKTHVFFMDGYEVEVEIIDNISLYCTASIWKSSEELLEVDFFLNDINADNIGTYFTWDYANECPKEETFTYDPYANGFEYCIDELEYYLTNVAVWKKAEL